MKENWGLQAADLAQERNVFVQKYGLPVRTSLTRADEIEYALETQLLNMPKENFFAMQNLEEPAEDVAQKAVKSVAKSALHSAVPGSMAARWLSKTPFFRGFGATGVSLARQSGAAVLKDTARAATAMGLGADTQTQRTQEIKQKLQEKGLPAALLPLEKSKADAQAIGQSITLKNWLEPNFAQEKLKALHKEQQKVDLFNQKVRFITEHFLQRTGLARNEKDGFWYDLGGGAASVLGSIGALVLTRNPYVGAVIFGAAEGQSSYEAAVEAGIAPQDAYWLGKANGAWIGATELIGDKFFSKLLYGKGILGKYSQRILEQSKKTSKLRQNISVAALSMAEGGFIEAAQETTQNMGTDLIHKYSGVEDKKIGQIIKDALYAGMLAFVLGGLPGGMAGMGAFRKYTENIKDELAAAGVEEKEAENLARETALTAIGSEFVGDSIKAVSAEINSPLTAEDRNPAEFARVLTQAQNREIDQTAWQVAEKVEQESLQAGVSPKVAAATGQVAQALTNGIYRLAKLTPKEQAHFNISILKGAQNRQVPAFNQAAAAMYRNPAKSLAEFVAFARKNKGNPKEDNKSYYRFATQENLKIEIPFERAVHIEQGHHLTAEELEIVENAFVKAEYALLLPKVGEYGGRQLKLKIDTKIGKMGSVLEILPNGRVFLNTAFFDSDANIDNWAKENLPNTPGEIPVFVGGDTNSIADIVQEIKGKNGSSAAFNQAAAAMYRNPAKSLAEFVDKVQKQKGQGKGSYFSFYQKDGVEIHLTNTAVWHDKKHTEMTPEMWEKAARNIENIEDYTFSSEKLKQGQTGTILLKINASESKFGIALDVFENGRIFAESVFTGTDAALDQWLQEQRSRNKKIKAAGSPAPHFIGVGQALQKSKSVLSGQPSIYSLANILEEIKPGKSIEEITSTTAYKTFEKEWTEADKLKEKTAFPSLHNAVLRNNAVLNNRILTKEDIVKAQALKTYHQTPADPRGSVEIDENSVNIKKTFYQKIEKDLFEVDDEIKKAVENDVSQCVQGKLPVWKEIELGLPSIALKQVGIPDYQLRLKQKTIKKDVQSKHAVKLSTIKNLPSLLADPLLILKSETESGSFVLALKDTDLNGKRIIAAIDPEGVIEINYIDSVYGKDDPYWFKKQVEKGNLLYIDEKEAQKESSHLYLRGVPYKASNKGSDIWGTLQLRPLHKQNLTNRILTKEDIVKAQALKTYHQTPADPRGSVEIDEQAHEAVIRIFENADPSTIVHELAHIYLTMLHESAKVSMDEDFQHLMQDIDTWLGEPNGADGSYSVEQQEQFARGFESYLAQGKAPNKELENVFEKFAAWLAEIYESVKDFLQISPEVSSIFDRLLTTQEPIKRSKIGQKVQAAKELAQAMKKGFGQDIDGVSVADMKELLRTLSTRKPPEPKEHLLKDLRKYGADYANAAAIDKEAYKNARVFDKKGGVGDHPAQWLMDKGYLSEQDAQTYEDQSKLDELAYQMIERALGGEKIYKLQDQPRAEERAAYEENLNTILEIFPDIPTAKESLRAIAVLESQGYRAVDKKDLQDLQRMLNLLGKMTERLEQEELKAKAGALERKALKIQEDAKRLKQRISEELDKRHLEHKQNMQNLLKSAKTPQEIYAAAEGVLGQLEKLWKQTEEGKQEHLRLNVPDTNWEQVKVKLLADFTRISQGAHQEVAQAQKALASFFGRILSEEEAQAKEKAEAVLKKADLESKYVRAMQSAMSGVVHISTADIAKYTAFLARSTQRHRLLTKRNVEQFIERAREIQLRNYKKYMAGKLTALFNRKIFEKAGTAKRLKYNELAARFLTEAGNIWKGSQVQAQSLYAARLKTIDPQNPPDGFTALINAVLSLKAEPDMAGAQDYYDVYQTALSAIRGDALQKRMEVLRRITQEQTLRVALAAQLDERKLGKSEISYILRGGVDFQTFISMVFGKGKFDKYEENRPIRQVDLSLQDWQNPTKDFILSPIDENIAQQIGVQNKPVLLKRNIIEKNKLHHKDLSIEEYNDILNRGLYTPVLVLKTNPTEKPNYFNFIFTTEDKNDNVVIEISAQKENAEIVSFYRIDKEKLDKKIERTNRNGGLSVKTLTRGPSPIRTPSVGSINSIADNKQNFKAEQYEIDFREELSPENEQMQAAVFKHQSRQKLVVAAMKAYGLNSADQVIDKMTELQNDKMQIVSYADIKDEQSGEMIARVFKNGKVYTDSGAKKQTITREEIITFWLWDQDHVFDENGQDYGLSGRLTRAYGRAQLEQMFAKLTPQDKAFGTALQQLLADVHQLESQTHRRIYGFALPHKAHYFPSVTDRNDDSIDYKQQIVDNAKAPSFIKERVKSGRPAQQRISPVKLVLRHLDRAGEFIFEAEKYAKLRRVVNNTALKNAFENKFGQSDGKALYKKLQDLIVQQGPTPLKTKDELFDLTEKAFNGWVKAALGAKIMVGVKQFASSISFAEQMPVHLWAKWFAEGLSRPFKTAQYMKELSPYIQVRYESGGVNEAVARAMTLDEISPVATRWNNLTNLLLLNTRMGDKASLIFGGYPYMKYLTDVKKLTPQEAARQFEKQAVRTLQSSLKANLSMAQADANSLPWRLMLTFKNQQMQYVRRLADGYVQYKNKEISLAQFGKTVWLYLVANPLVYTMLSLGYLADDDDERQKDILRLFSSPVSQFFDAWPFYGAAAEYAMQAAYQLLQGEKISAPNRIGTPAVDDFYKDVSKAVKTVNAEDVEATEFVQVWLEFAKYIGLPLGTFGNMLGGVKDLSRGKPTRGGLRVLGFTKKRAEKITGQED